MIGILIFPWKLIADPQGYIFKWLIAYSSLLGPVGGIMIADYFFLRRKKLDVGALYQGFGPYWYKRGFNLFAIAALVIGIAPNVPGFLVETGLLASDSTFGAFSGLYHYAWFIGFFVSGAVHWGLTEAFSNLRE